ncbi:MAG: gyrase subunit A protein [candidate division TM6 bacterium GW2011_GWF2_30_66]|jgi:DNA gyrase subunit A|nr:MAG: gyrase subunit A protein [candidate division TM6 bacterium GW2011_GWF2_30_66]
MEPLDNKGELPGLNGTNPGIKPVLIETELKESFLDYAMSVIVSRAIPDVRDGLKPVHRRVLYTMHKLGFYHNKPYHKSVRVVGEVLGKYHPHGDQAVYGTMVGMVQDFSKRYPLLDGQGNWGSVDGDNAAAMRYTEVRMMKVSQEILADLEKETVDFVPNFDESTVEPVILPSRLPNLLVNGTAGIAVGMATSIPPHNLGEVINACLRLLEKPEASDEEIFDLIPAPDFPTGGVICGRSGIIKGYKTGRGRVVVRGVVETEETKKGSRLIVTELPYQVNKAELIIKIADLVKNKIIDGISNIRDESDKQGMRVVIEIKKGEIPEVVLNQLYKHTPLQSAFSILMLALLDNKPLVFTLKQLLQHFIEHRKQVVYKRTVYDLTKAQEREHILAGFIIALQNIDEVIVLIKKSKNADEAIIELNRRYLLTAKQGKAILEMRLQRLTGMEQDKIYADLEEIKKEIAFLRAILEDQEVLKKEVVAELEEVKKNYSDARRSKISGPVDVLTEADLIPDEDVVVTITCKGYIKRVDLSTYDVQHRGGKGKMGMASLEEKDDFVQDLFVAKNHDSLLFFTNLGRVYGMSVFEVPEGSRTSKGRAVVNILPLAQDEKVVKLLCTRGMEGKFIMMITKDGIVKRTDAESFSKIRVSGIRGITLREGDELAFCNMSSGNGSVVIATAKGQGIRFSEEEVRVMGRQASGVIGIRCREGDYVVGMEIIPGQDGEILFATENGYGKQVTVEDFRLAHRGGVGVRTIPTDKRNGLVIGLAIIYEDSNILLIDGGGKIIRLSPKEIRTMGRQAKGVRLIRLEEGQKLATVVAFREDDKVEGQDDPEAGGEVDPKKEIQAKIKAAAREIKQASLNGDSQDLESIDSVNLDGEFALEDQAVDGFDASEDDQILDSSSQDQDIFNQF